MLKFWKGRLVGIVIEHASKDGLLEDNKYSGYSYDIIRLAIDREVSTESVILLWSIGWAMMK